MAITLEAESEPIMQLRGVLKLDALLFDLDGNFNFKGGINI